MGSFQAFALASALALVVAATPAQAALFGKSAKPSPQVSDGGLVEIRHAIDEQRFIDAGAMLDEAAMSGVRDPRLTLLGGDLNLARGRFAEALNSFKSLEATPEARAQALEGEGLALSALGRSDDALAALRKAVTENPGAWRSWNALGAEYDSRRGWVDAEAAYGEALTRSDGAAIVLNNRGYSRLLQNRLDDAVTDFSAALQKKPQFSEARTNLRFALALKGDYVRALAGAAPGERAGLLNNAGFAAGLRGDYAQARDLLEQAMKARGEYYARAAENMKLVADMEARGHAPP